MSSSTKTNQGAAAEPEDTPARAPAYDPRRFQTPHPDDSAGKGKGKGKGKPATSNKKATTTATAEPKGKDSVALGICGWCEEEGAKMKCSQCKGEVYCGRECQRVSRWTRVGTAATTNRRRRAAPSPTTATCRRRRHGKTLWVRLGLTAA